VKQEYEAGTLKYTRKHRNTENNDDTLQEHGPSEEWQPVETKPGSTHIHQCCDNIHGQKGCEGSKPCPCSRGGGSD
jgi:hypothetical protein